MLQGIGISACIIEEVQGIAAVGLPEKLTTCVVIGVLRAIDSLAGPQTIHIIDVADGVGAVYCCGKIPAMFPGEGPVCAVVVAGGITCCIVGNSMTVNSRKQVCPGGIAVGVAVAVAGENITRVVVTVGIAVGGGEKLAQIVLDVGHLAAVA